MDKVFELINTAWGWVLGLGLTTTGLSSFVLALVNTKKNRKLLRELISKNETLNKVNEELEEYRLRDNAHLELQQITSMMLTTLILNSNTSIHTKEYIAKLNEDSKNILLKITPKTVDALKIIEKEVPVIKDKINEQIEEIKEVGIQSINMVKEISKDADEIYKQILKEE